VGKPSSFRWDIFQGWPPCSRFGVREDDSPVISILRIGTLTMALTALALAACIVSPPDGRAGRSDRTPDACRLLTTTEVAEVLGTTKDRIRTDPIQLGPFSHNGINSVQTSGCGYIPANASHLGLVDLQLVRERDSSAASAVFHDVWAKPNAALVGGIGDEARQWDISRTGPTPSGEPELDTWLAVRKRNAILIVNWLGARVAADRRDIALHTLTTRAVGRL
jgi:hypothetical protein